MYDLSPMWDLREVSWGPTLARTHSSWSRLNDMVERRELGRRQALLRCAGATNGRGEKVEVLCDAIRPARGLASWRTR